MITTAENRQLTFDENGNAVVSATGDEDTANMHVTVGNGSAPADPTVGTNDGTISGRNGTVSTGVKITTGKDAHVKVVAADSAGTLGPVQSAKQARRQGTIGLSTTDSDTGSSTSFVTLRTVTIPAGALGTSGALRLLAHFDVDGAQGAWTVRMQLDGTTIMSFTASAGGFVGKLFMDGLLTNEGAANDQRTVGTTILEGAENIGMHDTGTAVDTSVDKDLTIQAQTQISSDLVTLATSLVELIPPGN